MGCSDGILSCRRVDTGEQTDLLALRVAALESSRGLPWFGLSAARLAAVDVDNASRSLSIDDHLLCCTLSSACVLEDTTASNPRTIPLERNTLTFLPANHLFKHRIRGTHQWAMLTVSPDRVSETLGEEIALNPQFGFQDERLAGLIAATMGEVHAGGVSGPLFAEGIIIALASQLTSRLGNKALPSLKPGRFSRGLLTKIDEYINDNLADKITIKDLASIAGMSQAHFCRSFKVMTGFTPMAHITQARLLRSRTLLAAGRPLRIVAATCGFSDQAHMTQVFRRELNTTPGAFVKLRRCRST